MFLPSISKSTFHTSDELLNTGHPKHYFEWNECQYEGVLTEVQTLFGFIKKSSGSLIEG